MDVPRGVRAFPPPALQVGALALLLFGSWAAAAAPALEAAEPAPVTAPAPVVAVAPTPVTARPPIVGAPTRILEWWLHFDAEVDTITTRAHEDLLRALPADAQVAVLIRDAGQESIFRDAVDVPPALRARLRFVRAGDGISIWARDRYVVVEREGRPTVLLPDPTSVVAERRGDLAAGAAMRTRHPGMRVRATSLDFEGGDILVGQHLALVGAGTVAANRRRLHLDGGGVVDAFEQALGRRVLVVGDNVAHLPHEHVDMYVHLLDDRTAVVGDPRLALAAWGRLHAGEEERQVMASLDWPREDEQREVVARYEDVVAQLVEEGLRVVRVPALHGPQDDFLLSWTNVVTERRADGAHVYLPSYGVKPLDDEARAVWSGLGYVVHAIDVTRPALEGGGVRCLTNTIRAPVVRHGPLAGAREEGARGVPR